MNPRQLMSHRPLLRGFVAVGVLSLLARSTWAAEPVRSVVELFTSQGCSSCPPADALMGRLSSEPGLLVLSYHVNYWDGLGWIDRFSSQASTDRQHAYARFLAEDSVFTPQVIVNGRYSVVGSREAAVRQAIESNREPLLPVGGALVKQPDGQFRLTLEGSAPSARIWEVRYVHRSTTTINAGENGGRRLDTFNDVTRIEDRGPLTPATMTLAPLQSPDDGLAILVQSTSDGRMLGAVSYQAFPR